MGAALCCSTKLTASGSTTVPVAATYVMDVFEDLPNAPSFITDLVEIEILRGSGIEEGMRYREVRVFQGRKMTMFKTVTNVCRDNDAFSVTVSVDLHKLGWDYYHAAEVFRIAVVPVSKTECTITWSMAFVSAGCIGKIRFALSQRCLLSALHKHVHEEINCYAEEAMRRLKKDSECALWNNESTRT